MSAIPRVFGLQLAMKVVIFVEKLKYISLSSQYVLKQLEHFLKTFSLNRLQNTSTISGRQNALLATISEKDANIALLELSPTTSSEREVKQLKAEKDELVTELKEQVNLVKVTAYDQDRHIYYVCLFFSLGSARLASDRTIYFIVTAHVHSSPRGPPTIISYQVIKD